MTFEIICADFCFQFEVFSENLLLNAWNWKLDPWKASGSIPLSENTAIIHIACKQALKVLHGSLNLISIKKTGFFEHRIFRMENGDTLWDFVRVAENCCYLRYNVNANWNRITLLKDITNTNGIAAFEYLTRMIPGILLKQNILTFHGVLMEYQGYGIIISATSGTGKTTHARLWRDLNHALIINGDCTAVRMKDGVWTGYGLPWSGTSGEQMNRNVPLKALVVLERDSENEAHQITGLEAFSAVLPHLQYPAWDKERVNIAMENINQFLSAIPVIRLRCRPDAEAVDVLAQALEDL